MRRRLLWAAAAVTLVAAQFAVGVASAPTALGTSTSFSFGVVGDHGGSTAAQNTFRAAGAAGLDFFQSVGDLSYTTDPETTWCSTVKSTINSGAGKSPADPYGQQFPFQIISGNHESDGIHGLIDNFIAPGCLPDRLGTSGSPNLGTGSTGSNYGKEFYYDYPASAPLARFIMVDPAMTFTHGGLFDFSAGSPRYQWLSSTIDEARANGIRWIIVGNHFNYISAAGYGASGLSDYVNLLVSKKVDLVVQGHDHSYQRSKQLSLSSACPSIQNEPATFNNSCVTAPTTNAAGDVYAKGGGPVLMIVGNGGESYYGVSAPDRDSAYFRKLMVDPTSGFLKVTVAASALSADFVPGTGNTGTFTDHFQIVGEADLTAPNAPTGLTGTGSATPSVSLSWTAATDNVAVTSYNVYRDGVLLANAVPSTTYTDTAVLPANAYTYTVKAVDGAGNVGPASAPVTVDVPVGSNTLYSDAFPGADGSAWPSAWTTSIASGGAAVQQSGEGRLKTSTTASSYARAQLTGVTSTTDSEVLFTYNVSDATNSTASSYFSVFLRGAGGWQNGYRPKTGYGLEIPSKYPSVTVRKNVNGTLTNLASLTAGQTVTTAKQWCRFRVVGSTISVRIWPVGSTEPTAWTWSGTDSTAPITTAGQLFVSDVSGSSATVANALTMDNLVLTKGQTDFTAPTAPTNLQASSVTQTSAALSWTAATDNVGVTGYRVYRDGALRGTVTGTTFTDTGLTDSTSYNYTVKAYDAAGNVGAASNPLTVTTLAPPDSSAPSVPTGLTATTVTDMQVVLSWTASTDNVGVTGYDILRDGLRVGSSTGTTYGDDGLTPSTSYRYTIRAKDAAGNLSAESAAIQVRTLDPADETQPSEPTALVATGVSDTSATLSWTASTDNVGVTGYRVYRGATLVADQAGTSYTDTGLTASTTYSYTVLAYDAAGNASLPSAPLSVTTIPTPDTTAPSAPTGLVASEIGQTSVHLSWAPATDNVGVVAYRVTRGGVLVGTVTSESYDDSGLSASTTYTYRVRAVDAAGNVSAASTALNVTTDRLPDTTPPTVPSGLVASDVTQTALTLSWSPSTDDTGVSAYRVFRDGTLVGTVTDVTSFADSGLTPQTTYSYTVRALDAAGNVSAASMALAVTTLTPPDVTAPSAPGSLTASTLTATSVHLSWTAASDDVGVTEYGVYRDGALVALVGGLGYTDSALLPDTSYVYAVRAFDAAGNSSVPSADVEVRTLQLPDTTPPTVPADVAAAQVTDQSVLLSWSASSDNRQLAGYRVFRDGVQVGQVVGTSLLDDGLAPATPYSYVVTAYDAAGNVSAGSTPLAVTTLSPPDTTAPSVPTGVTVSGVSASSVTLSWTASTDDVAVTGYHVLRDGALVATGVTGTSYTDTGLSSATSYSYTLTAVDAAGNTSATTAPVQVTTADGVAPSVPTGLTATTGTTSVTLSWTASTDNVAVVGYRVSRNGVLVADVTSGTSHTDTTVTPAVEYTYVVTAYDAAGNVSAASTPTTATVADTTAPSTPTGVSVSGVSASSVTLSWTASTDDVAVTGYHVLRDGALVATGVTGTSYTDTGLSSATSYSYTLTAVDAAGNTSPTTAPVQVTTADGVAPSVPTGVVATTGTTSVTLSWTASTDDVAVVGYRVSRNGVLVADVTSGTSHTDTTVTPAVEYTYVVTAYDAAGNVSAASTPTTATVADTTAPSTPTGVSVSGVSASSVTLSWTASTDDVAVTGYHVLRDGALVATGVTGTSYTDTGLSSATSYSYTLTAVDAAGNTSPTTAPVQVTTADGVAPSVPTGLTATTGTTSVTLSWTASTDNVAVVGYRVSRNGVLVADVTSGTSHTDTTVTPAVEYTYVVTAYDAAGNVSAASTPTTATVADTTAPSTPTGVSVSGVSASSVTLSWTASTDDVAVTGYHVLRDGALVATGVTGTSYTDTGLSSATSYSYTLTAVDAAGNTSPTTAPVQVTTADGVAPSVPTGVVATTGTTSVTLSWTASTDDVAVVGYRVSRNGVLVADVTSGTSHTDTTVTPAVEYTYVVTAYDAAGNVSAASTPTTATVADTTAPSTPTGVSVSGVSASSVTLSWTASTDDVGVTQYHLFRDGALVATGVTGTSYTDTGLSSATSYSYTLTAVDAAGNTSPTTAPVQVTTADGVAPSVPTGLTATTGTTSVTLSWTASTDNVAVVGYRVSRNGVLVADVTSGTSHTDTTVTPAVEYTYVVTAYDAAGNVSAASTPTTATVADTTAPSTPTGVSVSGVSASSVTLSWTASTDDVAVTGYHVLRDGALVATGVTGTSYTDTGLSSATPYSYTLTAVDAAGNTSPTTAPVQVTTADGVAPSVPTGLTATTGTTSVTLSWTASTDNVAVVGYRVSRNGVLVADVTSGTSHTDTTVTPAVEYTYVVTAYDAAGNVSAASTPTTATVADTTAPSTPTGVSVSGVSASSVTLSWTASTDDVGVTQYHLFRDGALVATGVTGTSYTDTGLSSATPYSYTLTAVDAAGNTSATTAPVQVTTADGVAPSVPTGVVATTGTTSVTLSWTASTDNVAVVGYRVSRNGVLVADVTSGTSHTDTTVTPAVEYTYVVTAYDAAGNVSAASTPTTATVADTTAPSTPTGVSVSGVSASSVTLSWTASTDDVGVTQYHLFRDGALVATGVTGTSYTDTGLSSATSYSYTLTAVDAAGNTSATTTPVHVTTALPPDTTAPSTPTGLTASAASATSATLAWTPSTDDRGVTGYQVIRNGSVVASVTSGTSYSDTALAPSTTYTYAVTAYDAAGNVSAASSTVQVTTPAPPDTTAPTAPTALAGSSVSAASGATLTWTASTDNVGVTGYRVFRDGTQVATGVTTTSYTDTGVVAGGSYVYTVRANDAAGNLSAPSTSVTVVVPLYWYNFTGTASSPWSSSWTTSASTGASVTIASNAGRLASTLTNGSYARARLTGITARADADVTLSYRFESSAAGGTFSVFLRGAPDWSSPYRPNNGYGVEIASNASGVTIRKSASGTTSTLANIAKANTVGTTKQWLRLRVSGSTIAFKIWVDGANEPATWTGTVTDTTVTAPGQLFISVATSSSAKAAPTVTIDDLRLLP